MLEVKLKEATLEGCREFIQKELNHLPPQEREVIFIIDNKEDIDKEIRALYDSLPIRVPFDFKLADNVKITAQLQVNNKLYNNWIGIETFSGAMYFVEEKDIEVL